MFACVERSIHKPVGEDTGSNGNILGGNTASVSLSVLITPQSLSVEFMYDAIFSAMRKPTGYIATLFPSRRHQSRV